MTLYLNGTSGISGVDGSAGTPAIQGTDANTGVLFPAADTWAVAVGGVEKIRVQSSGMSGCITAGTAVASTSGTSIDFTGIPSWVKRVTVMFNGVSTNGSSNYLIQLGDSGGIEATGYAASGGGMDSAVATSTYTTGFGIRAGNASNSLSGHAVITLESSNSWICSGVISSALGLLLILAGSKSLSGTLDRIRVTTVNGTDTFDAGSINILYEG